MDSITTTLKTLGKKFLPPKENLLKSNEEVYFNWYLLELYKAGLINNYWYEPFSLTLFSEEEGKFIEQVQLKTKIKTVERTLLLRHEYTPDFVIDWNEKAFNLIVGNSKRFPFFVEAGFIKSYIDTKGVFNRNEGDRVLSINQKWLYQKYRIYVQKIIPQKLFKKTFIPERYLYTDGGSRLRKLNYKAINLKTYLQTLEEK